VHKVTAKMAERAQWEQDVRERMTAEERRGGGGGEDSGGEDVIGVFDGDEASDTALGGKAKEKGKAKASAELESGGMDSSASGSKRRRGAADFFDDRASRTAGLERSTPAAERPAKKSKKKRAEAEGEAFSSGAGTPSQLSAAEDVQPPKKRKRSRLTTTE